MFNIFKLNKHRKEDADRSKNVLYSISLVLLIDSIGYGVIFPILPQLFLDKNVGLVLPLYFSLPTLYSLTLTAYPFAQFFGMAFFGTMSDRYGRKLLLLSGMGMMISAYFLSMCAVLAHSFSLFILSRLLGGFFGGIYSVSNALVCDISGPDQDKRLKNFVLPALATKLGAVIGPVLAIFAVANPIFSNILAVPFAVTVCFAVCNFFLLLYTFKKMPTIVKLPIVEPKRAFGFLHLFDAFYYVFRSKTTCLLATAFLIYQWASNLFAQGVSLYLTVDFDYHTTQLGFYSAVMSFCIILSIYGAKYFVKKGSHFILLKIIMLVLMALFFCGYCAEKFNESLIYSMVIRVWLLAIIFNFTLPLMRLLFQTIFCGTTSVDQEGLMMGAMGQISAVSCILSALMVGHIVLAHYMLLVMTCAFLAVFICLYFWRPAGVIFGKI